MSAWVRNAMLLAFVVLLAGVAVVARGTTEFRGVDDQSTEAITEIAPEHRPWMEPVFDPADSEPYIFGLQGLIGAGVVAFCLGWLGARHDRRRGGFVNPTPSPVRIAVIAGLAAAFALAFVETDNGELQALKLALQGIGLATLLLPAGRWAGGRAGDSRTGREQTAA